jgi:hypothetical protein
MFTKGLLSFYLVVVVVYSSSAGVIFWGALPCLVFIWCLLVCGHVIAFFSLFVFLEM